MTPWPALISHAAANPALRPGLLFTHPALWEAHLECLLLNIAGVWPCAMPKPPKPVIMSPRFTFLVPQTLILELGVCLYSCFFYDCCQIFCFGYAWCAAFCFVLAGGVWGLMVSSASGPGVTSGRQYDILSCERNYVGSSAATYVDGLLSARVPQGKW